MRSCLSCVSDASASQKGTFSSLSGPNLQGDARAWRWSSAAAHVQTPVPHIQAASARVRAGSMVLMWRHAGLGGGARTHAAVSQAGLGMHFA